MMDGMEGEYPCRLKSSCAARRNFRYNVGRTVINRPAHIHIIMPVSNPGIYKKCRFEGQVLSLIYRMAEQQDKKEIYNILVASFTPTYAYYARKSFEDLNNVLVAEDEGTVIAVINWRVFDVGDKRIGYLFWLAVLPEYRRMGIARNLIQHAIMKMQQESGLVEVYAAVEKNNIPSQSLIKSLGFTFISRGDMKKKYGLRCPRLYFQMMLLPKEDLFILYL